MLDFTRYDIQAIREELYLGKGYVVLRKIVPSVTIKHLSSFWNTTTKHRLKQNFSKHKDIALQCSDQSVEQQQQFVHYNFFWNSPKDESTYSLAWQLQAFRNQLEGQPLDWGYLPHYKTAGEQKDLRYVSSYRVVCTQAGKPVPVHSDWDLDHAKIQCSLQLSSFGEDYQEGGMLIHDEFREGTAINISEKENLQAGDLLLFRYAHPHGVASIVPGPSGRGFERMLLPIELVDLKDKQWPHRIKKKVAFYQIKWQAALQGQKPNFDQLFSSKQRLVRGQGTALYYDKEVAELMEIAIKEGLSPAHVYLHRGLWGRFHLFQKWQMDACLALGLQAHHQVLDLGCGILRLGMLLIPFLDDDRYCGIDPVADYIRLGDRYLQEHIQTDKQYHLLVDRDFSFEQFDRMFDFAIAQSVFTHLSFAQIDACFCALKKVMRPTAKLIFTVSTGKEKEENVLYIDDQPMTKSGHEGLRFYNELSRKYKINITFDSVVTHPTQQLGIAMF